MYKEKTQEGDNMAKQLELHVLVELEIIRHELGKVGVNVPIEVLSKWRIDSRAKAEQWAIKTRWRKMKKPPCPAGHSLTPGPLPAVLKKWMESAFVGQSN
jgi:hypothetical protein